MDCWKEQVLLGDEELDEDEQEMVRVPERVLITPCKLVFVYMQIRQMSEQTS